MKRQVISDVLRGRQCHEETGHQRCTEGDSDMKRQVIRDVLRTVT